MVGIEWIIDAEGCSPSALCDHATLHAVCDQVLADLDLRVVGAGVWHQFPGWGGWTGLFLLTESHLTCHTYPEDGIVTFNLYCCKEREPWPWPERLRTLLGAKHVVVRCVRRGSEGPVKASVAQAWEEQTS